MDFRKYINESKINQDDYDAQLDSMISTIRGYKVVILNGTIRVEHPKYPRDIVVKFVKSRGSIGITSGRDKKRLDTALDKININPQKIEQTLASLIGVIDSKSVSLTPSEGHDRAKEIKEEFDKLKDEAVEYIDAFGAVKSNEKIAKKLAHYSGDVSPAMLVRFFSNEL